MTSKQVWNLTNIFFRYMSPINYIIVYDPKTRTISKNTKKKLWFYTQTVAILLTGMIGVYFIVHPDSESVKNSKSNQAMKSMFGILYAGILGLYAVFTFSVGCRGDAFYCCFNTLLRLQDKLQST